MVSAPTETTLAALRTDERWCDFEGLPDEKLLDRFLGPDRTAAEDAFLALVRRHGPMVRGVCRRILDQLHDAEDASQATFLVLARKAGRIRDRRALGRWLYRVAYRTAVCTRTGSARRRTHEGLAAGMSAVTPGPEHHTSWSVLRLVLHEEVDRLPATYRSAVVLCYLEECTDEEAAALLRWPVGTVKSRLARARELLRARLTRRGLAPDRL
jgi:RNA polymerase sigma factor (sigma-70 family)